MSWFGKEEKVIEKPKPKVLCPYCEKVVEKIKSVDMIMNQVEGNEDYDWNARVLYCPHCNKILNIWNWE